MEDTTTNALTAGGLVGAHSPKQKAHILVEECDNGFVISEHNKYPMKKKVTKYASEVGNIVADFLGVKEVKEEEADR